LQKGAKRQEKFTNGGGDWLINKRFFGKRSRAAMALGRKDY
jgi:hypothetical protein